MSNTPGFCVPVLIISSAVRAGHCVLCKWEHYRSQSGKRESSPGYKDQNPTPKHGFAQMTGNLKKKEKLVLVALV